MFLALVLDVHAVCGELVAASDLEARLESAEQSFASLDVDGFVASMDQAELSLPCLAVPMTPELAAHVHRDFGLRAYVDRDPEAAAAAFASARLLEPDFSFSTELLPPDHDIRDVYASRSLVGDAREDVPEPAAGRILLDGKAGAQRPVERPVVFQVVDDANTPSRTAYLNPGDPLPDYAKAVVEDVVAVELPSEPLVQPRYVAMGSGAVAVASGVLYGVAYSQKASLSTTPPDNGDDLESLIDSNHKLVITSGALAGVAAVGGASSLALWKF